jgi:hypothetical protein
MMEAAEIDRMHDAILDTIRECDAELHESVLLRLDAVAASWEV